MHPSITIIFFTLFHWRSKYSISHSQIPWICIWSKWIDWIHPSTAFFLGHIACPRHTRQRLSIKHQTSMTIVEPSSLCLVLPCLFKRYEVLFCDVCLHHFPRHPVSQPGRFNRPRHKGIASFPSPPLTKDVFSSWLFFILSIIFFFSYYILSFTSGFTLPSPCQCQCQPGTPHSFTTTRLELPCLLKFLKVSWTDRFPPFDTIMFFHRQQMSIELVSSNLQLIRLCLSSVRCNNHSNHLLPPFLFIYPLIIPLYLQYFMICWLL